LLRAGIIAHASSLNDFLEGMNDHRPLHCVVDIGTGEPMLRKLNGELGMTDPYHTCC
jgi:hypothetical protein